MALKDTGEKEAVVSLLWCEVGQGSQEPSWNHKEGLEVLPPTPQETLTAPPFLQDIIPAVTGVAHHTWCQIKSLLSVQYKYILLGLKGNRYSRLKLLNF